MKKILVTGADGFIGRLVVKQLASSYQIIALGNVRTENNAKTVGNRYSGNITNKKFIESICRTHVPDVVIHCAGIAHQSILKPVPHQVYDAVNHLAAVQLARVVGKSNPNVHFIFLSSISVYGEKNRSAIISENEPCRPSSAYARSKLDAEWGLKTLLHKAGIGKLDILRLAPVYDESWSLNLEKRVFGPKKIVFIKYGGGKQKISALARRNLVDFIEFRVNSGCQAGGLNIINVLDNKNYSFNELIHVFKRVPGTVYKPTLSLPLSLTRLVTRLAGVLISARKEWFHACYDKLTNDLIFDNTRMLDTGFKPGHTMETVLFPKEK